MYRAIGAGLIIAAIGLAVGAFLLYTTTRTVLGPTVGTEGLGGTTNTGALTGSLVNDLGPVKVGSVPETRFELRNQSGRTIRILGAADGCYAGICVFLRTDLPLDIPPGQTASLDFHCHLRNPGPFQESVAVYTDELSQSVMKLTITGEVVE